MKLKEMIAVLEAAQRGEKIEYTDKRHSNWVCPDIPFIPLWDFSCFDYRIAPKPEPKLVAHYPGIYIEGIGIASQNICTKLV